MRAILHYADGKERTFDVEEPEGGWKSVVNDGTDAFVLFNFAGVQDNVAHYKERT